MDGASHDTLVQAASHNENRRAFRRAVRLRAQLRGRGAPKFDVQVLDLSTTGFRADVVFTLHIGDVVWMTLPGLAGLEAIVAWRGAHQYGFAFRTPLHPAVFDHIFRLSQG